MITTLSDIHNDSIEIAYTDTTYTEDQFLRDIDSIAQDIWDAVVNMRRWEENWEIWYTNTVALQDEYRRPLATAIQSWCAYIETLSVTYDNTTYTNTGNKKYVPCRRATPEEIDDWEYELENHSKHDPIYFERDKSLFIAPDIRTSEAGVNRIKITWIRSIPSNLWTIETTLEETWLWRGLIDVLQFWIIWKIHMRKNRDPSVIQFAYNTYITEKKRKVLELNTERVSSISYPS